MTIGHVVSEFMFSLNAATYLSVHVTIETGASSAAELVNAAFRSFPCFTLAILITVQVPGLDFVAYVGARVFAGFLPELFGVLARFITHPRLEVSIPTEKA